MKDLSDAEDAPGYAALLEEICRQAAREAVKEAHEAGIPVTFARGKYVIRQYPDGKEEIVCEIKSFKTNEPENGSN